MTDELKERVKALAVEAGVAYIERGELHPSIREGCDTSDELLAFAQAVARDCAGVVMGILADCETRDVDDPPLHETAQAIRARYGLAS